MDVDNDTSKNLNSPKKRASVAGSTGSPAPYRKKGYENIDEEMKKMNKMVGLDDDEDDEDEEDKMMNKMVGLDDDAKDLDEDDDNDDDRRFAKIKVNPPVSQTQSQRLNPKDNIRNLLSKYNNRSQNQRSS